MTFIRKIKTASGATAIQIATKQKGRIIKIVHIGSAHTEEELIVLLALAQKQIQGNQLELLPELQPSLRVGLKNHFLDYCGILYKINMRKLVLDDYKTKYSKPYAL